MPKRVRYQGRVYVVPDEATDDQISDFILSQGSDAPAPDAPAGSPAATHARIGDPIKRFAGAAIENAGLNPVSMLRGMYNVVTSPVQTAKSVVAPLKRLPGGVRQLAGGDVTGGLNEIAASLPIVGPMGEEASARSKAGDWAGAAGAVAGTVASPFVPGAVARGGRAAAATNVAKNLGPTRMASRILNTTDDAAARAVLDEGLLLTGVRGGQRSVERQIARATDDAVDATREGLVDLRATNPRLVPQARIQGTDVRKSQAIKEAYAKNRDPQGIGSMQVGREVARVIDSPTMTSATLDDAIQQAEVMRRTSLNTPPGPRADAQRGIAAGIRQHVGNWLPHPREALATIDRLDPVQRTLRGADVPAGGVAPVGSSFLGSTLPYLIKRSGAPVTQMYDFGVRAATSDPMQAILKAALVEQLSREYDGGGR